MSGEKPCLDFSKNMVINILRQEINNLEAPKMKNGQDLLLRFCPSMFFGPTTENPSASKGKYHIENEIP